MLSKDWQLFGQALLHSMKEAYSQDHKAFPPLPTSKAISPASKAISPASKVISPTSKTISTTKAVSSKGVIPTKAPLLKQIEKKIDSNTTYIWKGS